MYNVGDIIGLRIGLTGLISCNIWCLMKKGALLVKLCIFGMCDTNTYMDICTVFPVSERESFTCIVQYDNLP